MLLCESPFRLELIGRILQKDGVPLEYSTRRVSDMLEVLMDPKKAGPDGAAYYMFRDVHTHGTLRYDITLIPPRMFGDEFVKTYGHFHPEAKAGLSYPELYQVLHGKAVFIMQSPRKDGSFDCIISRCKEGDTIFVPPNYGHVMVNPDPGSKLVSSNIVSSSFSSEYDEYKANRGAAYYFTRDGLSQNLNCIVRNTEELPPAEILSRYRVATGNLLEEITQRPQKLAFLEDPTLL